MSVAASHAHVHVYLNTSTSCTVQVTALYAPDDHWAPLWQKEVLDRSINAPLYRSFLVDASHAYPAYTACSEAVVKAWGAPLADVAAERV